MPTTKQLEARRNHIGGSDLLTNSRIERFKTCRMSHYFAYELGLRKQKTSNPLRFGRAYHLGLDAIKTSDVTAAIQVVTDAYAAIPLWVSTEEELFKWQTECVQVRTLVAGHAWRWANDGIEIIKSEFEFDLPIINPDTGRSSRKFRIGGKIDKAGLLNGKPVIIEYKTTIMPVEVGGDYWKRTRLDQQIALYLWAARQLGIEADRVVYDVVRKPGIRPKKGETLEEYEIRLHDDLRERPDFYFAREVIYRTDRQIDDFLRELWQVQKTIADALRYDRHYRSTSACTFPFRCTYLDICDHELDGVPEGFVKLGFIHPELEESEHGNASATATAADQHATAV